MTRSAPALGSALGVALGLDSFKHVDTIGQRPEDDVAPVEHRRILQGDEKLRRHLVRPRAHHDQ